MLRQSKLFLNAGEFYFPLLNPLYLRSGAADAPSWARLATTRLRATAITLFHGVLWALCLAALARGPRRPDGRVLALLGLVAVFPLPFLPFLVYIGHSQYVLPTIPLLSVLAAVGLGAARNRTPAS